MKAKVIKNNFIDRLTLSENVIMDNRDIEAQLKSLIGLNLSQNATGTLPISKGNVSSPCLNVSYVSHPQTPAERLELTPTAEAGEAAGAPEAQVRQIRNQIRETRSPTQPRRKEARPSSVGRPTPETERC